MFADDGSPIADLLTADEACRFLRLFEAKWEAVCEDMKAWPDDPAEAPYMQERAMDRAKEALAYMSDPQRPGHLRPVKVGKRNLYAKAELLRFIDPEGHGR